MVGETDDVGSEFRTEENGVVSDMEPLELEQLALDYLHQFVVHMYFTSALM
jgi:hypothetical protein